MRHILAAVGVVRLSSGSWCCALQVIHLTTKKKFALNRPQSPNKNEKRAIKHLRDIRAYYKSVNVSISRPL